MVQQEEHMEWFDVAISIEVEGEKFYRSLSEKAETDGVKNIFSMLADDEVKHKKRFEAMKRQDFTADPSDSKEKSKTIFSNTKKRHMAAESRHLKLYQEALDIEQKSIDFYNGQLGTQTDPQVRTALKQILAEEKFHYQMIDTILQMVERPERWVEFAEFGVREDY
jgi:rubrerythrin